MALDLIDLDDTTRRFMLKEVDREQASDSLYLGKDLSPEGIKQYPALLREAVESGHDQSLQLVLSAIGIFNAMGLRQGKPVKVPSNAAQRLAEGEFNRFYLRGLCLRAIDEGDKVILIYQARESQNPRSESEQLVGTTLDPEQLLDDLRTKYRRRHRPRPTTRPEFRLEWAPPQCPAAIVRSEDMVSVWAAVLLRHLRLK